MSTPVSSPGSNFPSRPTPSPDTIKNPQTPSVPGNSPSDQKALLEKALAPRPLFNLPALSITGPRLDINF